MGGKGSGNWRNKLVADVQSDIDKYFKTQDEKGRPYTIIGLGNALGMVRDTLLQYEKSDKYGAIVSAAKQKVREQVEERLMAGDSPAAAGIFWLKNNNKWKDKTELEVGGNVTLNIYMPDNGR